MRQRPIEILLVEDSPGDIWLTREALTHGSVPKNIHVVTNGEQAIDYLHKRGAFARAPRPDMVLLDLNLPRRDGLDVLREIKTDPNLKTITVIVLTTSQAPMDVNTAYDLNANCYVVKPVDFDEFTAAIRGIESFWMTLAALPTTTPPPLSGENPGKADRAAASEGGNGSEEPSSSVRRFRRHTPAQPRRVLLDDFGRRVRSILG